MILFGVCHGLRLGDVARMTWANIDAARRLLMFFPQKTARGAKRRAEEYPLHPDLEKCLEGIPAGDDPKAPPLPRLSRCRPTGAGGSSRRRR